MRSDPMLRQGYSTVDYESPDAKVNSEYQVCWSNTMDKGPYKNPTAYQGVHVLCLCWANNSDNMAAEDEINRLKTVFGERFHYQCQTAYLDIAKAGKLQVEVNAVVAQFVKAHDGPHTLLIVYYAGHGRPGGYYGALVMHNGRSAHGNDTDANKRNLDSVIWNKTEELLRPAEADILEIFDCCHAGTLGLTKGDTRSFEYLAATTAMAGTRVPGPDSFTSALIHALEYLVKEKPEGRFTTVELLNRIKQSPDFPEDQTPKLFDRESFDRTGRVMLHPLRSEGPKARISPKEDTPSEFVKQTVTLHFDFDHRPPWRIIETLGNELNHMFERNALGVNGVRWGGLKGSMTARVVQTLLDGRDRRASIKRERESVAAESSGSRSAEFTPEPRTPSSTIQDSPLIPELSIKEDPVIDPAFLSPTLPSHVSRESDLQIQDGQKRRKVTKEDHGPC